MKGCLKDTENKLSCSQIHLTDILQEETGETDQEAVLESITAENFSELEKGYVLSNNVLMESCGRILKVYLYFKTTQ